MRLTDLPALLIEDIVRTWTRRLIVAVVALVFGIAAIVHAIAAARLALEPVVGLVGARLVLVGAFLVVVVIAVVMLLRSERRDAAAKEAAAAKPVGSSEKVAVIAEAINLGYSLARDFRKDRAAEPPPSDAEQPPATTARPRDAAPPL